MFTLNCNGRLLVIDKPLVMGIVNATPDSFYEGSRFTGADRIIAQAEKMIGEGVDILDIGGQSTRPGSESVSADEELKRVLPGVEAVHKRFSDTIISVDTYYSRVAKECVSAGASIVNDISAGTLDQQMLVTVAALKVPYILMHMKGNPKTMQQHAHYEDIVREIIDFFIQKKEECRVAGIKDVIADPGFGFAKNIQHNFELLKKISAFHILGMPLLAGISRKSFIYKTLGISPDEALNGTTALNMAALMGGANILRVHDVKAAKEVTTLFEKMNRDV